MFVFHCILSALTIVCICLLWYACVRQERLRHKAEEHRDRALKTLDSVNESWRADRYELYAVKPMLDNANRRVEDYVDILFRLFVAFRKASDEYDQVRRGQK